MQTFVWISVKEKLPERKDPKICVSDEVLVSLQDGEVTVDRFNCDYNMWIRHPKLVTHWAEKPRPADKENE